MLEKLQSEVVLSRKAEGVLLLAVASVFGGALWLNSQLTPSPLFAQQWMNQVHPFLLAKVHGFYSKRRALPETVGELMAASELARFELDDAPMRWVKKTDHTGKQCYDAHVRWHGNRRLRFVPK